MTDNNNKDYDLLHFEDAFEDGRLVDNPTDINKDFHFREALELSKELGRPLTSEEMKRYEKSLAEMEGPFDLSKLPRVRINLKGLMEYAESQNKKVVDLTDEEKNMFVEHLEGNEK